MARRLTGSALLAHIHEAHGAQLLDSDLFERLQDQAEYVHAAMHNSRAHPGHFHHEDRVLHLWDATDEIEQIDTGAPGPCSQPLDPLGPETRRISR